VSALRFSSSEIAGALIAKTIHRGGRRTRTLYYVEQEERALYAADLGSAAPRVAPLSPDISLLI